MLAVELKRPPRSRDTKNIGCRVKNSDLEPIQQVADALFDGNYSRLFRTALDEYITQIHKSGELTTK